MKKLIIFAVVIAAVILGGCNPCKRLALKCPSHDSTTVTIETKRDTVWVRTPADSLVIVIPIAVIEDLDDLGLTVESDDQKVAVRIIHDTLFVESTCKEDSLQAIVDHLKITINNQKTIYEEVEVEVEVIKNGKFARFTMFFFILLVVIAIVVIGYRIKVGALRTALKRFQNPLGK